MPEVGEVVLAVEDDGPGVPEEIRRRWKVQRDTAKRGYDEAQGKVFLDRLSTDLRSEPTFSSVSTIVVCPLLSLRK